MRTITLLCATALSAMAQNAAPSPDKILLDSGLRDEAQERLPKARLTLETLSRTYPESPSAAKAKQELAALRLLQGAQFDLIRGRDNVAALTLQTLLATYPQSPLAKQARAALDAIR